MKAAELKREAEKMDKMHKEMKEKNIVMQAFDYHIK